MASPAPEHLFDLVGFDAEKAYSEKTQTLVPGPDDYPARQVSLHSLDKAHYAHYYADIVGTAMKTAYPGPLAWIELFAGPGMLRVRELNEFKAGSPVEAIAIRDPFDCYVFADSDSRCVRALDHRVGGKPGVTVLEGDANSAAVHDAILEAVPRNALVVLYADPEALDLDFATVKFFADRYKHLDLLLNFPVPGLHRALRAGQQSKASRVLGHAAPANLIELQPSTRAKTSLREYFERQLRGLGYEYFASEVITLYKKNSPLYDVMLASRSERARQFFEEAQRRGPDGQLRLGIF